MENEQKKPEVPSFVKILSNGNVEINTREGLFELREPNGEEFDAVERIASKTPNITEFTKAMMLVSKCMVKPSAIGELELKQKYKLSTCKRLAQAISIFVEDDMDFLWTSGTELRAIGGKESKLLSAFDTEKLRMNSDE